MQQHARESDNSNPTYMQLTLEWDRLSKYTGNDTFKTLALRNVEYIASLVSGLLSCTC